MSTGDQWPWIAYPGFYEAYPPGWPDYPARQWIVVSPNTGDSQILEELKKITELLELIAERVR